MAKLRVKLSHLRRVIREELVKEILHESLDTIGTTGLAAYVDDAAETKTAVVYTTEKAKAAIDILVNAKTAGRNPSLSNLLTIKSAIVGFTQIKKPRGAECRGAWEVSGITGPGKIVYSIAYALSPNGLIMPDRYNVSTAASDAWERYAAKTDKSNILPLGDCFTSHKEEWLNSAYKSPGGEGPFLEMLVDKHHEFMESLVGIIEIDDPEAAILDAGVAKFDRVMGFD